MSSSGVKTQPKYNRQYAERRFSRVYETVAGEQCIYCGMPSDGKVDHQPPVYVLHRFANGGMVTARQIREQFGPCKLVPCCTICNMGLGAYHGIDDNDRREEIVSWFLIDDRFPQDPLVLAVGTQLINERVDGTRGREIYEFPGVGRAVYIEALTGYIEGRYGASEEFPEWLKLCQAELAAWLREVPRRKSKYFLDMANLASYDLVPGARSDPRGQYTSTREPTDGH